MGASMSTIGGWALILCVAGFYAFGYTNEGKKAIQRTAKKVEDSEPTKQIKENAKRQRKEAFTKVAKVSDKATELKQRVVPSTIAPTTSTKSNKKADDSSDDNVDNKEFAKQLASIKQGTSFNGPKKSTEKKQKSVKQTHAQEKVTAPKSQPPVAAAAAPKVSPPSDGDDDESSAASPEVTAANAGDVSDMLERPGSTGPSVLRLTDTDNASAKKSKKAKAAEKAAETKKQRQNKAKVEAAKVAREEAEAERKVKLEAQRRLARISEGRAAKDGSAYVHASQPKSSAWTGANGTNGTSSDSAPTNGDFIPVQPLDTFDAPSSTQAPAPKAEPKSAPAAKSNNNWLSALPSEEEQMSLLKDDDNWATVESKKSRKKSGKVTSDNENSSVTSSVNKPQQLVPEVNEPVMIGASKTRRQSANKPASARPTSIFGKQSSFAALSNDDGAEEEQEWDV